MCTCKQKAGNKSIYSANASDWLWLTLLHDPITLTPGKEASEGHASAALNQSSPDKGKRRELTAEILFGAKCLLLYYSVSPSCTAQPFVLGKCILQRSPLKWHVMAERCRVKKKEVQGHRPVVGIRLQICLGCVVQHGALGLTQGLNAPLSSHASHPDTLC